MKKHIILLVIIFLCCSQSGKAQTHPNLILTAEGVENIKAQIENLPLLQKTLERTIAEVDNEIAKGIDVPVPKDMAGGYTHVQHKKNFLTLQKAGVLFQITEDEKYAVFVRDMLLEYAKLYPTLSQHPANRSYAPGKIFWQCLNDANWLVYVSQAYDCIYDWLKTEERKHLEKDLFRPYADYLSVGSPQFFNRIHNHSTWGIAGVGMIGFVMNDDELIERALHGLKKDNIDANQKDNDGGLIKMPGVENTGYFAQLDYPFSPDGYYTEGPYYQRYAMYPFLIFAQAIENNLPELKVFSYRDSVLVKAVSTLLNLTNSKGQFFPVNDAQKGMSYLSRELVSSVNIIYHFGSQDPELLSVAKLQNKVLLDDTGLSVAKAISEGKEQKFIKRSAEYRDGSDGNQGGLGILRTGSSEDELCVVMKYTAQGMGHGHFDKLAFLMYDKGEEVLQDYGFARFVNIEQKYGGAYLPENKTWAKQTIAHNTLVVNETSHFKGKLDIANLHHSDTYFFDDSNNIRIMSAKETNAYPGVQMHRTMAIISDSLFEKPLVIDIFRVESEDQNQYDLPFNFLGQVMLTNFDYAKTTILKPMGTEYGYQHLWKETSGKPEHTDTKLTWFSNQRFYTLTTLTSMDDELIFARIGANDPEFNLRRDASFIVRRKDEQNTVFVSAIESHGHYNPVSEIATYSFSSLTDLKLLFNSEQYTLVSYSHKSGKTRVLAISNQDNLKDSNHSLKVGERVYEWTGPYQLFN